MERLADQGHQFDVHKLDSKVSAYFKINIVYDWGATYQLVPSYIRWIKIAEGYIHTFKAHFLSVLAGVYPAFPNFMWYNLLAQTELTLNLLSQATLNLSISTWEYFNVAFDCAATSLGLIWYRIIIHATSNKRQSWDQTGREGFRVGPTLHHYQCIQAIDSKTKALSITDTA